MPLDLNPTGTNHKIILKFRWKSRCVKKISTTQEKNNDSDLDPKTQHKAIIIKNMWYCDNINGPQWSLEADYVNL